MLMVVTLPSFSRLAAPARGRLVVMERILGLPPPALLRGAPPAAQLGRTSRARLLSTRAASKQQAAAPAGTLPRVILKGGKSKLFSEFQSPTVYGGAVDRVVGRPPPQAGDLVLVCDGAEQPIGWGVFNPESMFRVRMMQLSDEFSPADLQQPGLLERLLQERLQQAVALRAALGLPSPHTNVFRLCNSEGDRLSGLIVDVLGDHLVVASSAAWVERHRELITATLQKLTGISSIMWRPSAEMLKEEGWPPAGSSSGSGSGSGNGSGAPGSSGSGNSKGTNAHGSSGEQAVPAAEGASSSSSSGSSDSSSGTASSSGVGSQEGASPAVVVLEAGIKYAAAPLGQKTGFYADQRDSRAALRQLAAGRRMLDLCCYSGGFAINAAVGGAEQVLGVDSSAAAVRLAQQNAELNGVGDRASFVRQDVADFMKEAVAQGQQWDIVVFDPPKLAPNRKSLPRATHKYRRLNAQAMRLVAPGGLLMTCSCSGAMSQSGEFLPMLQAAAREAGRRIVLLREAGAAMDHTLDPAYPEGKYLTNVLLRVL